jgi:FtsH-binding integral membrane protein
MIQLLKQRKNLLILTFLNLILQTIITKYTMNKSTLKKNQSRLWFILLILCQFFIIFLICMPFPILVRFLLFCLFSIINGIMLSMLQLNKTIENTVYYGTIGIFGIMAMIGIGLSVVGIELSRSFGLGLFYSLLLLLLYGIYKLIVGDIYHKLYSCFAVVLFSFYIVYDTNQLLQKKYIGDFISASLNYYLDILNIFVTINDLN